jgi:phospholipid/cholesterol/gamma-HCH transport system ATP-binding protein
MADRVDEKPIDTEDKDERDIVLSARDVTVGFGSKVVLDNLNLNIYRGEILGFVGASGTGKSVLMRTVLRLLPRRSGTINVSAQKSGGRWTFSVLNVSISGRPAPIDLLPKSP